MRVLTFGAGALGTYLGGSLALAGGHVVFLEQPAVLEQLRGRGLRLDLTSDRRRRGGQALSLAPDSVVFAGSVEEALGHGPFDAGFYALKSFDTSAVVESLRSFAAGLPPIFCFSNGVDNEAALGGVLGSHNVVPATVSTAIGRRAPGDIVLEKLRGIGIAMSHPVCRQVIDAANSAFLVARPFVNAAAMKWSKLLTNLIANATSAILDMTAAAVFANPSLYALEVGMLRECLAVMRAQGIPVVDLPGTPVQALAFAIRLPLWVSKPFLARAAGSGRGDKMPSFHIDLHSGRGKSEVEYLHGAVVRAGRQFDVPTPICELLTETLVALTRGSKGLNEYAHDPARLLAELQSRVSHR